MERERGSILRRTSDCAGSQQVDDIHVVSQVTEDFELRHQCLLLCGVSARCGTRNDGASRVKIYPEHKLEQFFVAIKGIKSSQKDVKCTQSEQSQVETRLEGSIKYR